MESKKRDVAGNALLQYFANVKITLIKITHGCPSFET